MKIVAQERKTPLTPMQVISELRKDSYQEFSPDLLNEIGVMFLTADNIADRNLAETVLVKALALENADSRFIAYCQLRRANGTASPETHEAIELFRSDVANKELIIAAEKKYWL